MRPQINHFKTTKSLNRYLSQIKPRQIFDLYQPLLRELYLNTHPRHYFAPRPKQDQAFTKYLRSLKPKNPKLGGSWVFFPWNDHLYHLIDRDRYYSLRTLRNRNLVPPSLQTKLSRATIAIAGLSVGKSAALSLTRYGIGSHFHLADNDSFELSNANRASYDLRHYDKPKLASTSKDLYYIDPYLDITEFPQGLTPRNLASFTKGADLIIDTFDHFPTKLALRHHAKKHRLPVLSGVDLEKGVLVIIERYDLEPKLDDSLFLNHLDKKALNKPSITKQDVTDFFIDMIGRDLHSPTLLKSVQAVGTTLTSYPQLIIASQLLASVFTLLAERIITGDKLASGRHHLDLPLLFDPN